MRSKCPGGSGKAEGFADGAGAKTIGKLALAAATRRSNPHIA
jgi:hypothetical protein